jgi:DNA-binding SARP family transcriptional activator
MVDVDFRILGRPDVYHDGKCLDIGAPKQRVVLAALLLGTDQTLSADRLVESVWWHPPAAASANLRGYLAGLRRALRVPGERDSRLRTIRGGGYQLTVFPGELDLDRFQGLVDQGERALRAGRAAEAADRLERALQLWRGRALDGVACGPALQAKVTWLDERRLAVAEQWAQLQLDLGRPESVVTELRTLVAEHPLRERLWSYLMLALARSGRPGEALAAYADLRAVLAGELGTDPGPELRQLYQLILHGDDQALERDPAPIGAGRVDAGPARPPTGRVEPVAGPPRQLPAGADGFCGRTGELDWLSQLLSGAVGWGGPVVVAIDGLAGVGKSALAVAAARTCMDGFPDGQLYVDLQGASPGLQPLAPIEVLGRFLRTLGVRPVAVPDDEAEAAAMFRSLVAQRRVLVVLDDAASVAQVRPLLPAGPGCAALVTSRDVLLGLTEAVRVPLGVLSTEDAVDLLGHLIGPARVAEDPAAAQRIVALCGHLPLALRIAAARLVARPGLPIAALADRLEAAQHRLDELAVADLAVRASLELTHRGLAAQTRTAFRRLGLLRQREFPSWALAALLDVPLAPAERLLDDLVAANLVEPAGESRYRLHDLVRLYAQEQAAATEPAHARAAAIRRLVGAALALAERADARLSADFLGVSRHRLPRWSLPQVEAERLTAQPRDWFEREHAFLVAAVDDGLDLGATGLAGCLAASLTTFFQISNRFDDWRRVQTRALAAAQRAGDRRTALKLHRGLGELDTIQDRYADAIRHFEAARALSTAQEPEYEAAVTAGLGYLRRLRGEYGAALRHFGRARQLAAAHDNLNGLVYATSGIGVVHLERGQLAEAAAHFAECLRLSRQAGYLPGEAQALRCLGHVERASHAYDAAAAYLRAAQEISERLGDRLGAAHAGCWLGEMWVRQGRHAEARWLLARCLWVYRDYANAWGEAGTLWVLAVAQLAVGRPRAACRRAEQAVTVWRRIGSPYWLAIGLDTLAEAHEALGEGAPAERARHEAKELRDRLGGPLS